VIDNPVGTNIDHVTSKENDLADRISRLKTSSNTLRGLDSLMQDFPTLRGCTQYHPSSQLISSIMDAILRKKLIDPLTANKAALTTPDSTSS